MLRIIFIKLIDTALLSTLIANNDSLALCNGIPNIVLTETRYQYDNITK